MSDTRSFTITLPAQSNRDPLFQAITLLAENAEATALFHRTISDKYYALLQRLSRMAKSTSVVAQRGYLDEMLEIVERDSHELTESMSAIQALHDIYRVMDWPKNLQPFRDGVSEALLHFSSGTTLDLEQMNRLDIYVQKLLAISAIVNEMCELFQPTGSKLELLTRRLKSILETNDNE